MDANKNLEHIKKEIANSAAVEACAHRHGTVGDLTAMRICYLFRHYPTLSVSQIAELTKISISAASRQLKKLKAADVLKRTKEAQTVYYSLQQNEFTHHLLEEMSQSSHQRKPRV